MLESHTMRAELMMSMTRESCAREPHHESRADDEHDTQERAGRALEYHACVVFEFLTGPLVASAVVWRMSAQGSSLISVCSKMASTAVSERRPRRFMTEDFIGCYRSHEHVAWTCA